MDACCAGAFITAQSYHALKKAHVNTQAKIQDLHKQIEELTSKVGGLQTENAALHSRTSILEKVLDMRNEQIQVMQESKEVGCLIVIVCISHVVQHGGVPEVIVSGSLAKPSSTKEAKTDLRNVTCLRKATNLASVTALCVHSQTVQQSHTRK